MDIKDDQLSDRVLDFEAPLDGTERKQTVIGTPATVTASWAFHVSEAPLRHAMEGAGRHTPACCSPFSCRSRSNQPHQLCRNHCRRSVVWARVAGTSTTVVECRRLNP
jgi:hypothetical protein